MRHPFQRPVEFPPVFGMAERRPDLEKQISDVVQGLADVSADLREISRGIHPAILSKGGLGPALKALARRSTVPIDLHLDLHRSVPDSVEVAAYYVVAEALTNTAKHAHASEVQVHVTTDSGSLQLRIRDVGFVDAQF